MKRITKKKIPVAKHVKKFLIYYFPEPYTLSYNDFIGPLICGLMKRGFRTDVVKRGEASFEVAFKDDQLKRLGKVIVWDQVIAFNKAVDDIFRKQLYSHMDLNRKLDENFARKSMVQFLVEMNITEEDIDYDSLYRDYKRKKNYAKTTIENIGSQLFKNNLTDLSPTFDGFVPKTT
jgi:hypothetical protein